MSISVLVKSSDSPLLLLDLYNEKTEPIIKAQPISANISVIIAGFFFMRKN